MEVQEVPEDEEQEILDIMAPYGLDRDTVQPIVEKLRANPDKFVDFMMRFELNLEAPDPKRSLVRRWWTWDEKGRVGKLSEQYAKTMHLNFRFLGSPLVDHTY
jgi:VIT family